MDRLLKRVWAEIDLDALDNNISLIKAAAKGKKVMAVVKANAYGHDVGIVARELWEQGIESYAVSNPVEGIELRKILPAAQIVVFGYCDREMQEEIAANNLEQTAASVEQAKMLSRRASESGKPIKMHIKVNSGMNRVGIDSREELLEIMELPGLEIKGVYTHFAVADSLTETDLKYTENQQKKFLDITVPAREKGIPFYSQNSGGIMYHDDFGGDMVRSGIITYGCAPNTAEKIPLGIKPVMRLRAAVCQVKTIPAGTQISYGRTFTAPKEMTVAVIPAGYADGYSRFLSNSGAVYIKGKRAPICGRVCMDQTIVDVTGIDVKCGDIAELYSDTIGEITVDSIADKLGTIGYELLCLVGRRVPRGAVRKGEIVEVANYI